jgi:hypothetical protein
MKTINKENSKIMRLNGLGLLGGAVLGLALFCARLKAQELIVDGGFESPVVGPGGFNSGFQSFNSGQTFGGAWTVIGSSSGNVSIVPHDETTGGGVTFTAAVGNQSLDLTGNVDLGTAVGVRQSITTVSGQQYRLSFYLGDMNNAGYGPSGTASVVIKLNGSAFQTVNNNGPSGLSPNWVLETFQFTATGPTTTLDFINNTAAGVAEAGLDQVSVMLVPEPAAVWLTVLGGLLCVLRKSRFAIR